MPSKPSKRNTENSITSNEAKVFSVIPIYDIPSLILLSLFTNRWYGYFSRDAVIKSMLASLEAYIETRRIAQHVWLA